jgi:lipopolysaccharide/colanic/teichoic acid biosynthesis glycosyltransferase
MEQYIIWHLSTKRKRKLILLGAGSIGRYITALLENAKLPIEVVGFVDANPALEGQKFGGSMVLGSDKKLSHFCMENDVDDVVACFRGKVGESALSQIMDCLEQGVHVTNFSGFVEEWFSRVPAEHIAIRCESKGPVFYNQIRIGLRNRTFRIWKLRTMTVNAESSGAQWAAENDHRITRIGKLLRKTRIDELPQLWNILRGEMSIVGPRPERPEFVVELIKEIPFYNQRHLMKPGLTGWAQINYPYGANSVDALRKLEYDLYYIKNASLGLDFQIVLRTIGVVMKGSR